MKPLIHCFQSYDSVCIAMHTRYFDKRYKHIRGLRTAKSVDISERASIVGLALACSSPA